jgi:hypothetical protein
MEVNKEYQIISKSTGFFLDTKSKGKGSELCVNKCSDSKSQVWILTKDNYIVNKEYPNLCVDISGSNIFPFASVILWDKGNFLNNNFN